MKCDWCGKQYDGRGGYKVDNKRQCSYKCNLEAQGKKFPGESDKERLIDLLEDLGATEALMQDAKCQNFIAIFSFAENGNITTCKEYSA